MPDLFEVIRQRRSIRKYKTTTVSKRIVEEVLVEAGWAPSAHNAQPWRFIVLFDHEVKLRVSAAMAEAWANDLKKDGVQVDPQVLNSRIGRFESAPVLVLACTTIEGMTTQPDKERQEIERDLALQSLGAALQNLQLAAEARGLGSCWFCAPAFCKNAVAKVLGIPRTVEPQALIILGYPAEQPAPPKRKNLSEYCFGNKWDLPF